MLRRGVCKDGSRAVAVEDWALLVRQADANEADAKGRLFAALYAELHRLAERQLRVNAGLCISPTDRKSTRLNSSHSGESRMPSSA